MRNQLVGLTTALIAVAVTAGCGMTGTPPNTPPQQAGQITVGDKSQHTQSVKCSQVQGSLTIEATADPGRAHAFLQLGGEKPIVKTVDIQNIDGLNGIVGGDSGKAEASANGSSIYTITGTAVVSDAAHPGQTNELPFKIEAPC